MSPRPTRPRPRLDRVLDLALRAGVLAIPLTVTWTVAGAHLAVGLAAASGLAHGLLLRRWPLRRSAADAAMLAFGIACLLATVTSQDPRLSFVGSKKLLLLPTVHLTAAALAGTLGARTGLRLFVGAAALTALVASALFLLGPRAEDARLRSTGHYMTFAGQLLLALPPAAAAAVATRGRRRAAYSVATVVLGAALLLTFTRSAWIGLVLAALCMLLRVRPRLALAVPPAVVLLLLVLPGAYRQRALSSFEPSHPFNQDRQRLWRAGVEIWKDHPWTGVGLVDLKPIYARYRRAPEGVVHGHLHDNWIHIAATTGTLGLLAFAGLMVGFGRLAWGAAGDAADPELRGLAHGLWGSFWGFQAMGVFEWNFGDVEVTIALYYLLGAALAARAVARAGTDPDP
jgi:O-antigen ligase